MSGKTQPQTRALHRAWCLLPGWKFSFVYPLAETFARAMPRAQQSLGLVHISRCAENLIVLRYFCSNVRSGGPQEHAQEESSKNHLTYGLSDIPKSLRNFHQNLPQDIISVFILCSLRSTFPFPDVLPFLNTPPGMESRC